MFKKHKKDERAPQSRTAYLTTIDGAFAGEHSDGRIADASLDSADEDERYDGMRPQGAHDAVGRAGGPKGSVRYGEGTAAQPRYFSMDPKSGEHLGTPPQPTRPPAESYDMVDDIEQRIIDAAGSRTPDGAAHEDRAIRARGSLIAAGVLTVLLFIALVVCVALALTQAAQADTQQKAATSTVTQSTDLAAAVSSSSSVSKTATVPQLADLIGATQQQALSKLGHGAQVDATSNYSDTKTGAVKRVAVILSEEPSVQSVGSPTVTLYLNDDGAVVSVTYQVAMSSLGYGDISFAQAVGTSAVIQNTLKDGGFAVNDDSVIALPSDAKTYSIYQSDGQTLTKQSLTFNGEGTAAGMTYQWTGTISYDYSKANASSNLADTIRVVTVGVSL